VLDPAEEPELAVRVGHDIVTSTGTTLLGADDKAGVAEIMGALEYLVAHPEPPHATVRVAFTVDEEIGRGAEYFDLDEFGAEGYTLTARAASSRSRFSARAVATIRGRRHPGRPRVA
jgi:tripeptide aminopeptidase